jgi:hypothetical protein
MLLKLEQERRFMRLFAGLLDYTNKKYDIVPGLDFRFRLPEDMEAVAVVKEHLWENDRIIDDYIKANPQNLTIEECEKILKWKYHNTGMFFYIGEDDGRSVFSDGHYFYHVLGHLKEIKDMLGGAGEMIPVETTLLPFEDAVVYDATISSFNTYLGPNVAGEMEEGYAMSKEDGRIIKTGEDFIEKMKVPKESRSKAWGAPSSQEEEASDVSEDQWEEMALEHQRIMEEEMKTFSRELAKLIMKEVGKKKPESEDLKDLLKTETKGKLKMVLDKLHIPGTSTDKKGQLLNKVKEELLEVDCLRRLLLFCREEEMELIQTIVENGATEVAVEDLFAIHNLFNAHGTILFTYSHGEKYYATVSREFRELYPKVMTKKYMDHRKKSITLSNYATVAATIYGVIPIEDFIGDMKRLYRRVVDKEFIVETLELGAADDEGAYTMMNGDIVHYDIVNDDGGEEWYRYVKARNQQIPRKEYTRRQVEEYEGRTGYREPRELQVIREFILENQEEALCRDMMIDLVMEKLRQAFIADAELSDIMEMLEEQYIVFGTDEMMVLIQLIIDGKNNTVIWGNNGWTPSQLAGKKATERDQKESTRAAYPRGKALPYVPPKKVGRNDPCPCGSGKKYKRCCLLKDN